MSPQQERRVEDRRAQPVPSRKPKIVLGFALTVLVCWSGYQQYQLSELSDSLTTDRVELQIQGINDHLKSLDDQVVESSEQLQNVLARPDFEAAHGALTRQFDELKKNVADLQGAGSDDEILALKAQIESIEEGIKALEKRVTAINVQRLSQSSRTAPSAAKKSQKPAKPVVLTPPFQVIGIEVRGGERFLSIAPQGASRLNQVSLIRPGDTQQAWRLESIGAATAQFQVNGTQQVVSVH